jgi:imidazoleglycerol-phosphate dehydratase
MAKRISEMNRNTKETEITIKLNLDGSGESSVNTGVGFFDHMLTLFGKHAMIDLDVQAKGDIEVDAHHTVEDIGILLGKAILDAVGDKKGIRRYGFSSLPMDETRVQTSLDFSGRAYLVYDVEIKDEKTGDFDTCLGKEFFLAFANNAEINLHIIQEDGDNAHHILEAAFKSTARALREAVSIDPREKGVPSTKGKL